MNNFVQYALRQCYINPLSVGTLYIVVNQTDAKTP